jgi:DNA repair protein RadA
MEHSLEIKDIEGIGPAMTKKLKDVGIVTVMDLASSSPADLAIDIKSNKDVASKYINSAQKLIRDTGFLGEITLASKQLEKRDALLRLTTGCVALDKLLIRGVESQAVTEFYGEFGSGKSQICHTLCVTASLPVEQGGLGGGTLYIDTEGTFRPERVKQIAIARGLNDADILDNIAVYPIMNSAGLEIAIKNLGKYVGDYKSKLVIIDSIIALHRADFLGRGTLADRQGRLTSIMHKLVIMAKIYDIAIVMTNQVSASPDTFFGDPTKATGGNIIGHASTYRVYLKKSGKNRIASMIDSPYHPYEAVRFTVNAKGVDDLDEELDKIKKEELVE